MDKAPKITPARPGAADKPAPAAPRKLDLQFGPTPSKPGSRLKGPGK